MKKNFLTSLTDAIRTPFTRGAKDDAMKELEEMSVEDTMPYTEKENTEDAELSKPLGFKEEEMEMVEIIVSDNDVETIEAKEEKMLGIEPDGVEKCSCIDIDADETTQEVVVEKAPTLLDNQPYMSLVAQCINIYEELSRIKEQTSDENMLNFIRMQEARIREALMLTGGRVIDEENVFNLLRHEPVPMAVANNGDAIEETLVSGIEIEDRVIIKAKVKLAKKEETAEEHDTEVMPKAEETTEVCSREDGSVEA